MLSLLFFTACLDKSQDPINPIEPVDPPIVIGGASCSETISEMEWEEEAPEGLSMARFMENIPESFTTSVILGEDEDAPSCLNVTLTPDASTLRYVESEIQEAEGEMSNMMEPLCFNHMLIDATLELSTEDGALSEELQVEFRIEFNDFDNNERVAQLHSDIDVSGSITSILPEEEIEGMYMSAYLNESGFSGSINASTVIIEGDFVTATRHELAAWDGELQESCE